MLRGVGLKLIVLASSGATLCSPHGELDTSYYVELARKVAHEAAGSNRAFFVSPFMFSSSALSSVERDSLMVARIAQIVFGTAAVGFLYSPRASVRERVAG